MVAESGMLLWIGINKSLAQIELHQQLRSLDCLLKYIHVTTPRVYGSTSDWIEEDFKFNLALSMPSYVCDMHLKTFFSGFDFPVIFTRSANVYGPGQQLYRVIPRAILSCKSEIKMSLHGDGASTRSFLHVDDMVDATIKICERGEPGETYHISDTKLISIKSLIELIAKEFELRLDQVATTTNERLGKDSSYKLSASKLRKDLNWEPKRSLDSGLKETILWVEKYYEELKDLPWITFTKHK